MKIRVDFVTNSSSSSYVVMMRNKIEVPNEIMEQYPIIKWAFKLVETALDAGNSISSKEELERNFLDNYGWTKKPTLVELFEDDPSLKDDFDEFLKKIEEGFTIYKLNIDYNEEALAKAIESMHDGKNCIVTHSC